MAVALSAVVCHLGTQLAGAWAVPSQVGAARARLRQGRPARG
jgi:hypothetical protein